jgi:hypothetical protein
MNASTTSAVGVVVCSLRNVGPPWGIGQAGALSAAPHPRQLLTSTRTSSRLGSSNDRVAHSCVNRSAIPRCGLSRVGLSRVVIGQMEEFEAKLSHSGLEPVVFESGNGGRPNAECPDRLHGEPILECDGGQHRETARNQSRCAGGGSSRRSMTGSRPSSMITSTRRIDALFTGLATTDRHKTFATATSSRPL